MTQPDDPLPYAPAPLIGDVTVDRRPDGVCVTLGRDTTRTTHGTILLGVALTLLAIGLAVSPPVGLVRGVEWTTSLILGAIAIGPLLAGLNDLIGGLRPTTLEVDADRLVVRRRRLNAIDRQSWDRASVSDIRLTRLTFSQTLTRPTALLIVLPSGQEVELLRGRRREMAIVADVLRGTLGLGGERWVELAYPPDLRSRRVERVIAETGVLVRVYPPVIDWWVMLPLTPIVFLACVAGVGLWSDLGRHVWEVWTRESIEGLIQAALFATMAIVAIGGSMFKWRKSVSIEVVDGRLSWSEISLLRPGEDEWPLERVVGVQAVAVQNGRRMTLTLELVDEPAVPLLRRERPAIVRHVADTLRIALNQHRPPATAPDAG